MMRRLAVAVACALLTLPACSGSGPEATGSTNASTDDAPRTDLDGNPLPAGQDWLGTGDGGGGGAGEGADAAAGEGGAPEFDEGVPYGCNDNVNPDEGPPEGQNPLGGKPVDDFPLSAVLTPPKADRGHEVTVEVETVNADPVLVVMVASFYDSDSHGMRAAKFADDAGRTRFAGPVPASAPLGWASVAVTATTESGQSAVTTLNLIVTGPGCE